MARARDDHSANHEQTGSAEVVVPVVPLIDKVCTLYENYRQ